MGRKPVKQSKRDPCIRADQPGSRRQKKPRKLRKVQEHSSLAAADTAHMPSTELTDEDFTEEGTIDLITMLIKAGLVPTRSEGRRAIEQGGVSIDGEKITDIKHTVAKDTLAGDGVVLKRGKKKFNRVYAK